MKRKRFILSSVFVFTIAMLQVGCMPPTYNEAAARIPELAPSQGRLVFYRLSDSHLLVTPRVYLDGEFFETCTAGGFFFVDVCEGQHRVHCERGVLGLRNSEMSLNVAAGETLWLRAIWEHKDPLALSTKLIIAYTVVPQEQALAEIGDLLYFGSPTQLTQLKE